VWVRGSEAASAERVPGSNCGAACKLGGLIRRRLGSSRCNDGDGEKLRRALRVMVFTYHKSYSVTVPNDFSHY
jgi:hypothetical protein